MRLPVKTPTPGPHSNKHTHTHTHTRALARARKLDMFYSQPFVNCMIGASIPRHKTYTLISTKPLKLKSPPNPNLDRNTQQTLQDPETLTLNPSTCTLSAKP